MFCSAPGALVSRSASDRDMSSQLLSYGAQTPILDAILSQAGFSAGNPVDALFNGTQCPAARHDGDGSAKR